MTTRKQTDVVIELLDDEGAMKRIVAGSIKRVADRTVTFIASHERVDADHEVVLVKGIDLSRYRQNPVLLDQHQWQERGIATVHHLHIEPVDGAPALVGEAIFPDRPQSNEALADIAAGLVRGISIGFKSLEQGPPMLDGQTGVTHTKTLLLEISLVSLPACPTCLVRRVKCACGPTSLSQRLTTSITDGLMAQLRRASATATVLEVDPDEVSDHDLARVGELMPTIVRDGVAAFVAAAIHERLDYARGRVQ